MQWTAELIAELEKRCVVHLSDGVPVPAALVKFLDAVIDHAVRKAGGSRGQLLRYVEFPWEPLTTMNLNYPAIGITHIGLKPGCADDMDFLYDYIQTHM